MAGEWYFQLKNSSCDPYGQLGCTVQLRVPLQFPGVEDMVAEDGLFGSPLPVIYWYDEPMAQPCPGTQIDCGQVMICGTAAFGGRLNSDFLETWVEVGGIKCSNLEQQAVQYAIRAMVCRTACRPPDVVVENLSFTQTKKLAKAIGCAIPPTDDCDDCKMCRIAGPGGANAGGGGGVGGGDGFGPGALLRYKAGGAGASGLPGSSAWNAALGRHWSHDYAQRIVLDPDETHVWLITERATFREFGNLSGGTYETLRPSDEYRTLHRIGTSGWELHDLDGTVIEFDAAGRWLSTTDRNGNQTSGSYVGDELVEVTFPDFRSEEFTYDGSGKLATIAEVGTDGTSELAWSYTWSGDDLVRIDRPDGTAWVMTYDDPNHPGYLTRLELEGTDGSSRRVETAWEYDAEGNVVKLWRGDPSYSGSNAVDRWAFSYDDPTDPTTTVVTDPLGDAATYAYDRDPVSDRPRLTSLSGDCPQCGLAANSTLAYGDPANPLRPTSTTDGNGNVSLFTYDANGRTTSRTEAEGTAVERTTIWEYDATFPALVAAMEQPSVEPGQVRRTEYDRDGSGNVLTQRIEGFEGGASFSHETAMTYNAQGQVLTVDPPGHGTADVTSYGYDASGLVLTSRSEPLVGATTYGHDHFNRRTSVTDPNGVTTDTSYDALDRMIQLIQRGATPAEDLTTAHVHTLFGDLGHTVLPRGNVVAYSYDPAGRLLSLERAADLATPGERTFYTLDGAGNRILGEQQNWSGSAWTTQAQTGYLYASRCHLDRILHPDGTATEYAYDCNGNLERTWDANHPSTGKTAPPTASYAYDPLDRLTAVTRPWSGAGGGTSSTAYGYDVQDHLTAVTDAEGNVTNYEYSDRDLLTEEGSPVSGTTSHAYDEHGALISTIDARGVTVTRTVDPLDRVTLVDYPTDPLDTSYVYDDPLVPFSTGRLTAINRDGQTVAYEYDRFGRMTRDGDLTFTYDANGNRTQIGYPGGVTAAYTHDFADREATLAVTTLAGTTPVVTAAGYLPSGPLAALDLGNGARETRIFDQRYFPVSIHLAAERTRSWSHTTDAVGNVAEIAATADCPAGVMVSNFSYTSETAVESCSTLEAGPAVTVETDAEVSFRAAEKVILHDGFAVAEGGSFAAATDPALSGDVTKSYGYQDVDYFLTSADGPWGNLAWTYDQIGNRLTETRNGFTDTYAYTLNAATGNTALLSSISLGVGGTRNFTYTAAGHQSQSAASGNTVAFDYDDEGRLSQASRPTAPSVEPVPFLYDGRSYLRQAGDLATTGTVRPTYDSAGLLHALLRQEGTAEPQRGYHFFYLAGRPVGQVATEDGSAERWWYFTTDHLGSTLIATAPDEAELWENRFEPFGADPLRGTPLSAREQEVFLRFPGQWEERVWGDVTVGAEMSFNVHRWYTPATGRYTRPDPVNLGVLDSVTQPRDLPLDPRSAYYLAILRTGSPKLEQPYLYGAQNPVLYLDPLGLFGPAALATAGGVCIAADGPVPIGDIVGVPLLIVAGGWAATEVIKDWWDNDDGCQECKPDPCDAQYAADSATCRSLGTEHLRALCWAKAAERYGACIANRPVPPLFPLE